MDRIPGIYKTNSSGLVTTWDVYVGVKIDPTAMATLTITMEYYLKNRLNGYLVIGVYPKYSGDGVYVMTRLLNRVKIQEVIKDYSLNIQRKIPTKEDISELRVVKYIMLDYYDKYLKFNHKAN